MNHFDIYTQKSKSDPFNLLSILFYAREIIRFVNTKENTFFIDAAF